MNYKRFENETENAFIYRICNNKDTIGSWQDVADVINKELGRTYDRSTYRKKFQSFNSIYSETSMFENNSELLEQIKEQRRLLEEEKVKFRDERNALNRLIREKARNETIYELFRKEIKAYEPISLEEPILSPCTEAMIIMLSDLHVGIGIDTSMNYYDDNVTANRLGTYIAKIRKIKELHKIDDCRLILGGDLISGNIHETIRIENREDVVRQVEVASELISEFIKQLAYMFINVDVHSVSGNHSRVTPNKSEHLKGENLDRLITFYAKAKLQNYMNVTFRTNGIDESVGSFICCGNLVYFVHGDKDSASNVVQKLTLMTDRKPDLVFMGHRHTNAMTTEYDTKIIECGCLSGSDNYCMDKRLKNKPEQVVAIVGSNGLECFYDIKFE